jgi:Concanavalin A-like lectin/glucanases superfamily
MMGRSMRLSVLAVAGPVALLLGLVVTPPAHAAVTPLGASPAATYQTNGIVWALAHANGVVYAGGTFSSVRPSGSAAGSDEVARANFAAFDAATGALITTCKPAFTISSGTATIRALSVSPDGNTLYVGGRFGTAGGTGVANLVALDIPSCTMKSSSEFARPSVSATVRAIAVNPVNSVVYFGGDFQTVNNTTRRLAAAVSSTGALQNWNPNATVLPNQSQYLSMRALTVSTDGSRIVLGGDFDYLNGTAAHRLAIVNNTNGAILNTFPGFIDQMSAVKALATDADGNHFYLGAEGTGGGVFDGRAKINIKTGAVVWRDNCLGATQAVLPVGDVLYSGHHAHDCSSTVGGFPNGARHYLLAQNTSDAAILPWFPNANDGIGEGLGPRALVWASGRLWVGGEFTLVNAVGQQALTRFAPKPSGNYTASAPTPSVASLTPGTVQVRWRAANDLDNETLTYRVYRDGVQVATVTGNSRFFSRPQLSHVDTVPAGSFHVYRLTVSDGISTSPLGGTMGITVTTSTKTYANAVLADNPIAYLRLNESAAPFAPSAQLSSPISGVYNSTGITYKQSGAIASDSADSSVTLANSRITTWNQQVNPQTYSVETWFKTTTTTGGKLVGFGNRTDSNNGNVLSSQYDRHLYMTNNGRIVFGAYNAGTHTATSPGSYNNGAWHHAVATSGPAGMRLYVDGVLVATNANTTSQNYTGYWRLGYDNLNGWPLAPVSRFFNGSLDETAIYGIQLSATQVAAHYAAR